MLVSGDRARGLLPGALAALASHIHAIVSELIGSHGQSDYSNSRGCKLQEVVICFYEFMIGYQ